MPILQQAQDKKIFLLLFCHLNFGFHLNFDICHSELDYIRIKGFKSLLFPCYSLLLLATPCYSLLFPEVRAFFHHQ